MSKKMSAREAARIEAERLAKQSAGGNRTRNILIGLIVVAILAIVGVGYMLVKESQKTLLTDFDGETPAVALDNGGITFGGPDALPGVVNEGAPKADIYADFQCPACAGFDQVHAADIRAMITEGTANITYHPVNILDRTPDATGYATRAANAFLEVVENEPAKALDFMEALFTNQPGGEGLTNEQIGEVAASVGVGAETIAKFSEGTYTEWINAARAQASRDGMTHTPSVAFDGKFRDFDWSVPGSLREEING